VILVDTSVWIDHLRAGNWELSALLSRNAVLMHPFVLGELACGNLANRNEVLELLADLPGAREAHHHEVLYFIETYRLMGRGIGYVDAHLLAATALNAPAKLWSFDRSLQKAAQDLKLHVDGV
jgi:predicted nucleic acid-binding protein